MSAYTDSAVAETTLGLTGVWLHDAADGGEGTAYNFPFGASQRELTIDTLGESNFYSGRVAPVIDYGEHEITSLRITVDVPHGSTWWADLEKIREFARARRTVVVRDNRGRMLYATLADYREADVDWGTRVSLAATAADWTVETVVV